jgi:hypothetical protein
VYCFLITATSGGTSGCVVAGRLAEDPSVSVLLIEAGQHIDKHPAAQMAGGCVFKLAWIGQTAYMIYSIRQILNTAADWNIVDEPCESLNNQQTPLGRGKYGRQRDSMTMGSTYVYTGCSVELAPVTSHCAFEVLRPITTIGFSLDGVERKYLSTCPRYLIAYLVLVNHTTNALPVRRKHFIQSLGSKPIPKPMEPAAQYTQHPTILPLSQNSYSSHTNPKAFRSSRIFSLPVRPLMDVGMQ